MIKILRKLWRSVVVLFVWRPRVLPQQPVERETDALPLASPEPVVSTPLPPPEPPPLPNRHARRAWERERRKRDKFVTPQGPTPISIPRGPRSKAAVPTEPFIDADDGRILIDGEDGVTYVENEMWGEFAFRDTILDQLDRYWVYLRRMKHRDADSYGFYCNIGGTVVPLIKWFLHAGVRKHEDRETAHLPEPNLSPWWREHRPAFGCVTYGISSRVEQDELRDDEGSKLCWVPKFLYFCKYSMPPPEIQPTSGGDVYKMTIWWDRPQDAKRAKKWKGGAPEEFAVFVSKDAKDVHALPMCKTEHIPARHKQGRSNTGNHLRGHAFSIPQRRWSIPRAYVHWAKRHGTDAKTFLRRLFIDAATAVERSHYSMVRIAVHNGDLTAIFGVDVKRIPYFFQDRDITLTEGGVKQRIFHIVRPHVRKSGDPVRFHFRGLREFTWAGYRVKITVPQRDHYMLSEFDVGSVDSGWIKPADRKKYVSEPDVGRRLAKDIDRGLGAFKPRAPP